MRIATVMVVMVLTACEAGRDPRVEASDASGSTDADQARRDGSASDAHEESDAGSGGSQDGGRTSGDDSGRWDAGGVTWWDVGLPDATTEEDTIRANCGELGRCIAGRFYRFDWTCQSRGAGILCMNECSNQTGCL